MSPHIGLKEERKPQAGEPESAEGFYVDDIADGSVIELETQHHHYTLEKGAGAQFLISGHPRFCPAPVAVEIEGSINDPPELDPRPGYIGRGMHMIFRHPVFDSVTTSRIREIHSRRSTW